ncbi:Polysialic acid transport protein KpsM [Gemmata obscuriglobus]|uniref:Transport permease protein n=1 Tax=Gemmata obscuriglobus TaxID=114 RepID=A0A2Z3H904_9BACT|nr:ABC transporter permease [Gemmata obscuriglobus]AWM40086.1 phosphate ABC transporter permease [Gemmata obscuriglobus]QEG26748.1 Polysialic acid transport protein KpsM [Gemmata obscuriglobus]VTS02534.1 phosphate abc transporter permease : Transport permease protein OS=Stanieria cyanosphaera (strain ATCC 29371 / PCC 7437) GN=Sta7437_1065 PE=3 SV=1: ABC2_membrane [Gemmata obscuriglobus UQM 2246]
MSRTVIQAGRTERQYWRDLWRFRELLFLLAWRDVSVRYKQTVIGIAWAVIRPLATTAVMVVVFGTVAKLPSGGAPYPLLVLSGMLGWQLFASGFSAASESLVGNGNLISKVYFPRLIIPLSAVAVSLIDFLVTLPVLLGLVAWYGADITWRLALLPLFVALALLAAVAVGVWLAALNVKFRDVRFVIPFVLQFGVYISPVGFGLGAVPEQYRWLFILNPAVGLIEGFRWALLGQACESTPYAVAVTVAATGATLVAGVRYFRRTEKTFADRI